MKAEPILQELETVKKRLAETAGGDIHCFLDHIDAWLEQHPHAGPTVKSRAELRARVENRSRTELPPPPAPSYRVHDPIIAEIHRLRTEHARGIAAESMVLKEKPRSPDKR